MPTMPLTSRFVESVKVDTRTDFYDRSRPGLVLRVSPEGRKTWNVVTRVNRRVRRATLGTFPVLSIADARDRAMAFLRQRDLGQDPVAIRREQGERTVNALAERYLEDYAKLRKRSWRDDRRRLQGKVVPAWRHRLAKDIARADVRELVNQSLKAGHPVEANRLRALLSKLFEFAISIDWLEVNPVSHVAKPAAETTRDRVLGDEELRTLWRGLEAKPPLLRAQTQLRLFTAQRGGEVSNARWADIDLEKGWWTIPATAAKNKLAHRVPLNRHAKALLQNLRSAASADQAMVFEGGRGKRQRTGAVDVEGLEDVRGHDLRRTVASRLASAGVPRLTIAKLLNHVERSVTSVYDRHSYDAEKRAAVEQWADLLDEVLETNPVRNQ